MKLPTLGPKSLAVIGVTLCFLIASFFSGCSLDEIAREATGTGCTFYPPGPGTYNIIYHDPDDPKGTFKHAMFTSDEKGTPFELPFLIGGQPSGVQDCDGIESYFKL